MKLLIDTTNPDLFVSLIKGEKTLYYTRLEAYVKKSDILPAVIKKLILDSKISFEDIHEVYVVNGPGSFMGIRAGMTFAKAFCLMSNAKLFGIDNLSFISQGINGTYYVDAKGNKCYKGIRNNNKTKINISENNIISKINYSNLIQKPIETLNLFKEIKNIENFEAFYLKDPQIGGM